jgi:chromosome partitioning protein
VNSEVSRIAELANSGERTIKRLRNMGFLFELRRGVAVHYGSAETAQLLGCSTTASVSLKKTGASPLPRRPKIIGGQIIRLRIC